MTRPERRRCALQHCSAVRRRPVQLSRGPGGAEWCSECECERMRDPNECTNALLLPPPLLLLLLRASATPFSASAGGEVGSRIQSIGRPVIP